MEFFIKKNATLPLLKLQVVKDGRSDYNRFMELIEESSIFFSMVDVATGIPKITTKPAGFVEKVQLDPNAETEYYIYYQFASFDTNREGRYEAQFLFRNSEGTLVLPIREKLFINVQESFIADDLQYDGCYVLEYPCCGTVCTTTTTPPCPSCPCGPSITPTPTPTTTSYILPFPTPSVSPENVGPNLEFCMEVMSGSPTPTPTINLTPTPTPTPSTPCCSLFEVYGGTSGSSSSFNVVNCSGYSEVITVSTGVTTGVCALSISIISGNGQSYLTTSCGCAPVFPTQTPTNTVTPTVTPTDPPPTSTVTPTITPTITPTTTITPSIGSSQTPTPTQSVTPTLTPTRTVTPTVTPTRTVTPTVTKTPTLTPTKTPTPTITPTTVPCITCTSFITPPVPGVNPTISWNGITITGSAPNNYVANNLAGICPVVPCPIVGCLTNPCAALGTTSLGSPPGGTYFLNFSSSITTITLRFVNISWDFASSVGESYTFTTHTGNPILSSCANCGVAINGNTISCASAAINQASIILTITKPGGFTQLTIDGNFNTPYSTAGTSMDICVASVPSPTQTPTPSPNTNSTIFLNFMSTPLCTPSRSRV
jgi:hypothetical protein